MSEQEACGHKDTRMLLQDTMQSSGESSDPAAWLRETDIVSYDFPYAGQLLADSFREWRGLKVPPFAQQWDWSLLNYRGEWTGAADAAGAQGRLWKEAWEQCAAASLISREPVASAAAAPSDSSGTMLLTIPVFTRSNGEIFALLGCAMPAAQYEQGGQHTAEAMALHFQTCFYRRFEHVFVSDLAGVHQHAERESSRRSLLFQIVQRMHDNIDVNAVLTEVIDSISAMYPGARLELFMSQDHRSTHPQVKPLPLRWGEEDVCAKAFKDGRVTLHAGRDSNSVEIGLPLGGKQGVYGVFHMMLDKPSFPDVDLRFLAMVADTAGTAFENAKLYERSNQLIRELRMSNELTQRLNQSLHLGDIFQYAFEELLEMFDADYCCILHLNEKKGGLEAIACNFPPLRGEIIENGKGLGGQVFALGEPLILSEYRSAAGISSRLMTATGSESAIATPLSVGGEVRGAIMLTHREPHFFPMTASGCCRRWPAISDWLSATRVCMRKCVIWRTGTV